MDALAVSRASQPHLLYHRYYPAMSQHAQLYFLADPRRSGGALCPTLFVCHPIDLCGGLDLLTIASKL